MGGEPFAVLSNLPYNVGTALFVRWLGGEQWPPLWTSLTLMFQQEVAQRIAAEPGGSAYGRLAVLAQWRSTAKLAMKVHRSAFTPPPKVMSAIVHVVPAVMPEGVSAIALIERGGEVTIGTADQQGLLDSSCELCGGCIAVCPTGAMTGKRALGIPPAPKPVRSTCNFCGVGCQVDLHVVDGRLSRVTSPPPGETVNDGNLCVKGRFAMEFVHHEDRLTTPLIRRNGELQPATWDEALNAVAEGLLGVKNKHGSGALGFISSSRCTGEENYLMQKLSRAAIGTW